MQPFYKQRKQTTPLLFRNTRYTLQLGSLLCLMALLLFSACRKEEDPVEKVDKEEFNAEERQLISNGIQQAIQADTDAFTLLDPQATGDIGLVYDYLNTIYQSLVNTAFVAHRNDLNWTIHLLHDDQSANTFITPGGALYITTGMLKTIRTEHELINVLAHEMMYADGIVLLEKLKDQFGGDVLGDIILGHNPPQLADIALALPEINYSEKEVLDADSYALDIICDFLYDPHGMRDFLKRLDVEEQNIKWLNNRTGSDDRPILVEQGASGCGPGSTFESRYQYHIARLP